MIDARLAPYGALVLRLSLSFFFFAHLYRKFVVNGFDPWWSGLIKQGYADWMLAYTVVLLLLGIYTRTVSLLTLPVILAVAYHWVVRKGFWFSDGGAEFALAWSFMLIAQAMLGSGAYALRVPELPWERGAQRAAA
jgi:putative oxidoreductase